MNNLTTKMAGLLLVCFAGVASAQDVEVDRLSYSSDTGNYVDRTTISKTKVLELPGKYLVMGEDGSDIVVCSALIDDDYFAIFNNEGDQGIDAVTFLTPDGSKIPLPKKDGLLKYSLQSNSSYEILTDQSEVSGCDKLLARLGAVSPTSVVGSTAGGVTGSSVIGVAEAIAIGIGAAAAIVIIDDEDDAVQESPAVPVASPS